MKTSALRMQAVVALAILATVALTAPTAGKPAKTSRLAHGKELYMNNCEACHMLGKNVIKPGKDIVTSSKLATLKTFSDFLSEKNGLMPAFKQIADDDEARRDLYKFVKTLKNQSWEYEGADTGTKEEPEEAPVKRPEPPAG